MNLTPIKLAFLANWTLKCWALDAITTGAVVHASSSSNELRPIVIPPSGYFEGNDGPWSTFDLRVGNPEQHVRVTVSTTSPQPLVVLSDYGCSTSVFETVPVNCTSSRGMSFNPNTSTSWDELDVYNRDFDKVLGYHHHYGLDNVGLGLAGPRLENQTVAVMSTAEPFYLGLFGLSNQPTNFAPVGNFSAPSFLTTLKNQNSIPSLSWSYTAGARYRSEKEYGQLILSGYDSSRFVENTATFHMTENSNRELIVYLQSIDYSDERSGLVLDLLSSPIIVYIDSNQPDFLLPDDVCDTFEQAFGLTTDKLTGLYLMNDTHHSSLLDRNAIITFTLFNGTDQINITLPYAAFGLTAENPLVNTTSYYFPLKRAQDSSWYTLGRTFLQEAYLSVEYENRTFNVSACTWFNRTEENVVTILPKDYQGDTDSSSQQSSHQNHGPKLSDRAIAGIVIGVIVVLSIWTGLVLRYWRRMVGSKNARASTHGDHSNSDIDGKYRKAELSAEDSEIRDTNTYELDSVGKVHELSGESQPGELADTSTPAELQDTQTTQ